MEDLLLQGYEIATGKQALVAQCHDWCKDIRKEKRRFLPKGHKLEIVYEKNCWGDYNLYFDLKNKEHFKKSQEIGGIVCIYERQNLCK